MSIHQQRRSTDPSPQFDEWKTGISQQLRSISHEIAEMKQNMVSRKEFEPIVAKVQSHDRLVTRGVRSLAWLGVGTLIASLISPHSQAVLHFMESLWR